MGGTIVSIDGTTNESSTEEGRPATTSHDQPPCSVGHPRPQRGPAIGHPQGALPAASLVTSRGGGSGRRGGRPLIGWLPTGKGNRRLRRGSSDGDDTDGVRGVRASF
ncbi:hypothetical protein B296_00044827 [Ensete ventricosum]|uniref:Uncharacterized protein n=1 Tax=Ensete ventricosum TaxID=4639 RepID=A0A426YXB7_ENSVE|nr:hypothetical protein B296_00044827 [Ensete ventricosum]